MVLCWSRKKASIAFENIKNGAVKLITHPVTYIAVGAVIKALLSDAENEKLASENRMLRENEGQQIEKINQLSKELEIEKAEMGRVASDGLRNGSSEAGRKMREMRDQ